MSAENQAHNQTIFGQVEPILDTTLEDEEKIKRQAEQAALGSKPWFKQPKFIILLAVGSVVLLLVALSLSSGAPVNPTQPASEPALTPTSVPQALDLPAQIKLKREELKKLEFHDDELAFPQIDQEINIKLKN